MKHASFAIAIAAFIVACSSAKDGTNAPAPPTAKTSDTTAAETSDATAGKAIESAPAKTDEKWPAAAWTRDASVDASRFMPLEDGFPGTYSLLVVSGGEVVFERYQAPYAKDSVIHVNSCTKTVIAMLFGMVFSEDVAENENRPAVDFFPEYALEDPLLRPIRVKHFLSMSSGLKWDGGIDAADVVKMSKTNDWARYVFERQVSGPPGESFLYNSGGSQVVSTILNKQTKGGLLAFAVERLFDPLQISEFKWDRTSKGVPKAGWGLHLKMEDMAKLGYLLLRKGKWRNTQIVPEQWVSTLSSKHVVANERYDYGYQVWIPKTIGAGGFMFRGSYPPSIKVVAVLPELDSVVVYVGENYETIELFRDFVVPALKREPDP